MSEGVPRNILLIKINQTPFWSRRDLNEETVRSHVYMVGLDQY